MNAREELLDALSQTEAWAERARLAALKFRPRKEPGVSDKIAKSAVQAREWARDGQRKVKARRQAKAAGRRGRKSRAVA